MVCLSLPFFSFAAEPSLLDNARRAAAEAAAQKAAAIAEGQRLDDRIFNTAFAIAKSNIQIDQRRGKCNATPEQEKAMIRALAIQLMKNQQVQRGVQLPYKIILSCNIGAVGAGGATTFSFVLPQRMPRGTKGELVAVIMFVQGSFEDILEIVLPHEGTHTLNAIDCRRPLPRFGDEGSAYLAECVRGRMKDFEKAHQVIVQGKGQYIPLKELLDIMEYPKDMKKTSVLYAEGSALSDFIMTRATEVTGRPLTVEQGRKLMVSFMETAYTSGWEATLKHNQKIIGGISSVDELEDAFQEWMKSGKAKMYIFKD